MNRFRQWMMGRYGNDALGIFLIVVYFILSFVNMRFPSIFILLGTYVVFILWVMRAMSRNIYRRQLENQKFLAITAPIRKQFSLAKRRFKERKYSRFYQCPKCHQVIRVPKGKGKIVITCPKCRLEFTKRT